MSKGGTRRDIRNLEKRIRNCTEGNPEMVGETQPDNRLLGILISGGPSLPAAQRRNSLKADYVARGTALREQMSGVAVSAKKTARVSAMPVLARYAAVAAVVILILSGLGLGSAYAMPGNPLYSIKRAGESTYISMMSGDQSKADAYASYAGQRLDELEYAEEREMTKWYYPLYRDAQDGIDKTVNYGQKLGSAAEEEAMEKAAVLTLRLESMLEKALGEMTPAERKNAEKQLQRLRIQLNITNGTTPGPSQQNAQPQNRTGQQGTPPSGSEEQQESEQQQQQEQQQNRQTQPGSTTQPGQQDSRDQAPDNNGDQKKQNENQSTVDEETGATTDQPSPKVETAPDKSGR